MNSSAQFKQSLKSFPMNCGRATITVHFLNGHIVSTLDSAN